VPGGTPVKTLAALIAVILMFLAAVYYAVVWSRLA
jgi:hypothetical protein